MKRWEPAWGTRFITFSCEDRLQLLGNPKVRDVVSECLRIARARFGFRLYAWVIMPEHVHILARPSESATLERVLRALKIGSAQRVLTRWKELDAPVLGRLQRADGGYRFWQKGGGFDRVVRDRAAFCKYVRYIHLNPVERGLVADPADWAWSSVRAWISGWSGGSMCDPPGDPAVWSRWKGFM
jgi:putative transposase